MPLREMNDQEKAHLRAILSEGLNIEIGHEELDEAITEYNRVTDSIDGRIPGDVHDLVLNYFARRKAAELFPGSDYTQMEIGVLFGGSLILGMKANQSSESPNRVIAVDPLDGYYMSDPNKANPIDKISQRPVNRQILESNLDSCGVDKSDLTVLQMLSTSDECADLCRNRKLSFLFIDGDHTYQGIENDWTKFSPLVVERGLVIIDNVNDCAWIEVNKYIYDMLQSSAYQDWGVRVVYRNSLVLQKAVPHQSVAYEGFLSSLRMSSNVEERLDDGQSKVKKMVATSKARYLTAKQELQVIRSEHKKLKKEYKDLKLEHRELKLEHRELKLEFEKGLMYLAAKELRHRCSRIMGK